MSARSKAIGAVLNAYLSSRPAKHAFYGVGRVLRGGRRRATLYYRADDPYSHLLAQVAPRLSTEYGVEIEIVPAEGGVEITSEVVVTETVTPSPLVYLYVFMSTLS